MRLAGGGDEEALTALGSSLSGPDRLLQVLPVVVRDGGQAVKPSGAPDRTGGRRVSAPAPDSLPTWCWSKDSDMFTAGDTCVGGQDAVRQVYGGKRTRSTLWRALQELGGDRVPCLEPAATVFRGLGGGGLSAEGGGTPAICGRAGVAGKVALSLGLHRGSGWRSPGPRCPGRTRRAGRYQRGEGAGRRLKSLSERVRRGSHDRLAVDVSGRCRSMRADPPGRAVPTAGLDFISNAGVLRAGSVKTQAERTSSCPPR